MFEKLDSLPWDRIRHIYGPATDLPDALRASIAGGTFHEKAYGEFYNLICHQGTTSEASSAVVPFLVELATDSTTPGPENFLFALAEISADPENQSPHNFVAEVLPTLFPFLEHSTPAMRAGMRHVLAQLRKRQRPSRLPCAQLSTANHFRCCGRAFSSVWAKPPIRPQKHFPASRNVCLDVGHPNTFCFGHRVDQCVP